MKQYETHVIVIGAGYAGLLASVRLAIKTRDHKVQITLINPTDIFVERPRLHQFAANQKLVQRPIAEVLQGTGVQFVQAEVATLDPQKREVLARTSNGTQRLAYDYLLYTAGSTVDVGRVPGVPQYAYTLTPAGPRSAEALRSLLPELDRQQGRLVVVGGGPTGIEAAAEFAESYPGLQVTLVTEGRLGDLWGGKIQTHIQKALPRLGVSIREGMLIERVEPGVLVASGGGSIPFDLCLWAGGFVASPLAREAGLAVNERGQVLVDQYMRSISSRWIYAAGDSAQPAVSLGMPVRMAAYTAAITGAHAADCLADEILGRQPRPLNFAYLGQGIALGRHDAVDFNNFPDDKPKWPIITGLAGVYGREFFVNLFADLPQIERRLPGLHFWPRWGNRKLHHVFQKG